MFQLRVALTGFNVQFLDGMSPPKKLTQDSVAVLPYIDNLTVIGLDKTLVQKAKEVAVTRLRRFFVVHEEVNATTCFDVLGYHVDGERGLVEIKSQ
eukprot:5312434-Amphidinium_carterae.1